jgi:hypothetical protein
MTSPKLDTLGRPIGKRRNNQRPSEGLTEASFLLKCPADLLKRVRERAKAEGVPMSEVWRRGALLYLSRGIGG